jgi:hypothetical protein
MMLFRTNDRSELKPKGDLLPFDVSIHIPKVILSVGVISQTMPFLSAWSLCYSLKKTGYRVAFVRLVGTSSTLFNAATALPCRSFDFETGFKSLGYDSTQFLSHETLLDIFQTLIYQAEKAIQPEYIIIDIGADILQKETSRLLQDRLFVDSVHNVMYSCSKGGGSLSDWYTLNDWGCPPFMIVRPDKMNQRLLQQLQKCVDVPIITCGDILEGKAVEILRGESERLKSINPRQCHTEAMTKLKWDFPYR